MQPVGPFFAFDVVLAGFRGPVKDPRSSSSVVDKMGVGRPMPLEVDNMAREPFHFFCTLRSYCVLIFVFKATYTGISDDGEK
jgi:hypothetical protein